MAGKEEGPAIGIDLGTSYSCVGVWQDDHVEIIANDQGNRTTPSFVAFTDTERLIGDSAMNQAGENAINTVFSKLSPINLNFMVNLLNAFIYIYICRIMTIFVLKLLPMQDECVYQF